MLRRVEEKAGSCNNCSLPGKTERFRSIRAIFNNYEPEKEGVINELRNWRERKERCGCSLPGGFTKITGQHRKEPWEYILTDTYEVGHIDTFHLQWKNFTEGTQASPGR